MRVRVVLVICAFLNVCQSLSASGAADLPARTPGEFEPVQAVVVQWDFGLYDRLLAFLIDQIQQAGASAIILVDDQRNRQHAVAYLKDQGVSTRNAEFVVTSTDSMWTRDYGPTSVFLGDRMQLALVDWYFKYPGHTQDDRCPSVISGLSGYDLISMDEGERQVALSGGDFTADGFGTAFSSRAIEEENPERLDRVLQLLRSHMGLERHYLLNRLALGPDSHIDMYMKLLDEETILVGEYEPGAKGDAILEANAEYLKTLSSCYGRPYRVFRIPMPGDTAERDYRNYTNSLIVNNRVLVPLYGVEADQRALQIYRDIMPAYEVCGFDCSDVIRDDGAIHCMTHEIHAEQVVRIAHPRFSTPVAVGSTLCFRATCLSPRPVVEVLLSLQVPRDGGYVTYPMTRQGNSWSVCVEVRSPGEARYSITAHASGLVGYRPQNAFCGGYLTVEVEGDGQRRGTPWRRRVSHRR